MQWYCCFNFLICLETSADTKEQTQKPTILWAAYFNMLDGGVVRDALPSNVHVTSGPGAQLGFDEAMEKARRIFQKICPEEEFLPRAPDHEEIVFDDEVCNTENNGSDAVDEQEEGVGGGDPVDEDDTDLREEREVGVKARSVDTVKEMIINLFLTTGLKKTPAL